MLSVNAAMRVGMAMVVIAAAAPDAAAQRREFGAKAGPSFGMLAFEPDAGEGYDRRVSTDGGGFFVLPLAGPLALQLEALFTSKGAKLYDPDQDLTGAILLHYFDLPILVRIQGPRSASRSFHVFGGPYTGVRLNAKREVWTSAGFGRTGGTEDMSREVERFETGLVVGAGLDIGRRIVIDGRYLRALSALNTDKSDGFRIRNRGIAVMAGVRF